MGLITSMTYISSVGKQYGLLTVLDEYTNEKGSRVCLCKCACGNTALAYKGNITAGRTKSCGCLEEKNRKKFADLTGKAFGRLKAVAPTDQRRDGNVVWKLWGKGRCLSMAIAPFQENILIECEDNFCEALAIYAIRHGQTENYPYEIQITGTDDFAELQSIYWSLNTVNGAKSGVNAVIRIVQTSGVKVYNLSGSQRDVYRKLNSEENKEKVSTLLQD